MSRYIDIEFILNETDEFEYENGVLHSLSGNSAPSIDIVRCKECKSYDTEAYQNGYGYCSNHMSVLEDGDFCSRGEREGE